MALKSDFVWIWGEIVAIHTNALDIVLYTTMQNEQSRENNPLGSRTDNKQTKIVFFCYGNERATNNEKECRLKNLPILKCDKIRLTIKNAFDERKNRNAHIEMLRNAPSTLQMCFFSRLFFHHVPVFGTNAILIQIMDFLLFIWIRVGAFEESILDEIINRYLHRVCKLKIPTTFDFFPFFSYVFSAAISKDLFVGRFEHCMQL